MRPTLNLTFYTHEWIRNFLAHFKHRKVSIFTSRDDKNRFLKNFPNNKPQLIDAVKIAQKMEEQKQDQQNQEQNQQNQQNQQQNLLPPSAELKLLRLTQLRINRRTVDFEMQLNNEEVKNDVLKRQVNEVTILQKKVTESARELAARGQQPLESEID